MQKECSCGCCPPPPAEKAEQGKATKICEHKTEPPAAACACGCDAAHSNGNGSTSGCADGHGHDHNDICSCGCEGDDGGEKRLTSVYIAAPLLVLGLLLAGTYPQAGLAMHLGAAVIASWRILLAAGRNILRGRIFDEKFLMSVAFLGAMAIGEYAEGIAVMLLYQVGEYFESRAVGRSRRSISALLSLRPDSISLLRDGQWTQVAPEMAQIGDSVMIRPGERVALDCVVREGSSLLDCSALTGESMPVRMEPGDSAPGGAVNLNGLLTAEVKHIYAQSAAARVLEMVEHARERKAKSESFITAFARYYTPAVVAAAIMLALLPPLIGQQEFGPWVYRSLVLLVISCPCALVISVPLTFFAGIGGLAKAGVLVKGGNYVQALARAEIAAFDKTGTLTAGRFRVSEINAIGLSERELLRLAATAEAVSPHPAALSIRMAWQEMSGGEAPPNPEAVEEIAGRGLKARVGGIEILAGSIAFLTGENIAAADTGKAGLEVHVAIDHVYAGFIRVEDEIKPESAAAIRALKQLGLRKTALLSGDRVAEAERVAALLGIDEARGALLPGDKLQELNMLLAEKGKGSLLYTGDGVNDAPVLARADVGIAMGGLGADAAIEAADVVIMGDSPLKLVEAVLLSRRVMGIVRQNVALALGIKAVVMALGAFGLADMWMAVFADVGVTLLAVLNAMRGRAASVTLEAASREIHAG